MSAPDPARCPLCGEENRCGVAAGSSSCWCFEAPPVPGEVLARVPAEAQGVACVCQRCARGKSAGGTDDGSSPSRRRSEALRWIKR